jgi:hypothetical protein
VTDDLDALALAFMDRQTTVGTRSYVGSGRRFKRLNKPDLYALWAAAFIDLCRGDRMRLRDLDELGAEAELRNMQKPSELAREALEVVRNRRKGAGEERPPLLDDLKNTIDELLAALKPKH